MTKIDGEKLGKNLQALRKASELTLIELGEKLGLGKSAISKYESGNIPSTEILTLYANFFGQTIEDLCFGDFTYIADVPQIDTEKVVKAIIDMFPFDLDKKKTENADCKEAITWHEAILKNIEKEELSLDSPAFISCRKLYMKAEKSGDIQAVANLLSLYALIGFFAVGGSISYVEDPEERFEEGSINPFVIRALLDHSSNAKEKRKAAKDDYLKRAWGPMRSRIQKLKNTSGFTYLGDYYLALLYCYDLVQNDQTEEVNRSVGFELARIFAEMRNPWIKRIFAFFIPE